MTGLNLTYFAETLSKGLKQFLMGENIKVKNLDFQELENNIIKELELPYNQQMQTPTQLLNNFAKKNFNFDKVITPQNLGEDAHEQIMLWGVLKAKNYND
jgi:flagella basal body P-ring formation protein FlgA